ncbi:MAG: HupE / UreJ protein [Bacteroidetes bacterium]|nr:HupE / UreJ protein [Bacteroidota bacterium]
MVLHRLGHIASFGGSDHILFLVALCAAYTVKQWKSLLVLITAFTIGHSFTLALSVLRILNINAAFVELLIPVTILLTCTWNIYSRNRPASGNFRLNYWMALFFGLVHGLGFSTLLRSLLGNSQSILSPLFAFNTGLEAGQLIIVSLIMVFSVALTGIFRIRKPNFDFFVSSAVFSIACMMIVERSMELWN